MHELRIFNKEIIPVYETDKGEKVVYGRELQEKLKLTREYTNWIKDMIAYGFQESIDFEEFWEKVSDANLGGVGLNEIYDNTQFRSVQQATACGYRKNHLLSADMAKHIAMIQRTPEGKSIRQKLIDLEKEPRTAEIPRVTFQDVAATVPLIAKDLHLNDTGRLIMYKGLCKDYGVPTGFLPNYTEGGNRESKPATELLKQFGYTVGVVTFNKQLMKNGILEERTRKSTSGKDGIKKYKALTEKGLQYGLNQVSPQNPKETQPYYYADTFCELYESLI